MKIGWILSGNRDVAGARIQGWNIHDALLRKGYDSHVLYSPAGFSKHLELDDAAIMNLLDTGCDVLFIQKLYDNGCLRQLIGAAKARGIKIVYICMDRVNPFLADAADRVFAVSDHLKELLGEQNQDKTIVIFDGFEQDLQLRKEHSDLKEITLVYVSNNVYSAFPQVPLLPPGVSLKIIGPPQKRVLKYHPGQALFTETPFPFHYVEWSLETVTAEVLACDVGVLPYPDEVVDSSVVKRKSANRLIYLMSLGLPVVASPAEEFRKLIVQGKNGFIAKTPDEWTAFITLLRDDPPLRRRIGERAREDVVSVYSLEKQVEFYESLLRTLMVGDV